jgi:phage portal protein BeeE
MGIFTRTKAEAPSVQKAAAGMSNTMYVGGFQGNNAGLQMVGQYYSYYEGPSRNAAMQVPAIARGRSLICSMVASTPLQMYNEVWDEEAGEMMKKYIAPRSWLRQPDPSVTYSFLMSWTVDDLIMYGRAFWLITERTADGFPSKYTRLPAAMCVTRDQPGPVYFAPSNQVYFQGGQIDENNLVQFLCGEEGLINQTEQSVQTALRLEQARLRNAQSTMPSGVLYQTGGEPLSADELSEIAQAFNAARVNGNQTAALNEYMKYEETTATPDKMLLIDAARFQGEEITRIMGVPPYLAGYSIGSYSYTNSKSAREDLYLFAARQYANCIAETLSMPNITPRGTFVCFDIDDYLAEVIAVEDADNETPDETMPEENTQEALAQ